MPPRTVTGMVGNGPGNDVGKVGETNQLVGLCTMLALVQEHLPDELLVRLIWGLGGPRVFAETLIKVQLQIEDDGGTALLQPVRQALARVRAHIAEGAWAHEGAAQLGGPSAVLSVPAPTRQGYTP